MYKGLNILIANDEKTFNQIPHGAPVLGINASGRGWDLARRCPLGVILPIEEPDGFHTVAWTALTETPEQLAFVAAVRREPGKVWIVAQELSLDVAVAIITLVDRTQAEPQSKPLPETLECSIFERRDRQLLYRRWHALVERVDQTYRFVHGMIRTWPGEQPIYQPFVPHGFGFPHEVRLVAPLEQIVRWTKDTDQNALEHALEGIAEWLGTSRDYGMTTFEDARVVGTQALAEGNVRTLLLAARQQACSERHAAFAELRQQKIFPRPILDGRMVRLDLRGKPVRPETTANFCFRVAPVALILFTTEASSEKRTVDGFFPVWFHERYFDRDGFLTDVRKMEQRDGEWRATGWLQKSHGNAVSPRNGSSFTEETLLALMQKHLR